MVENKKTMLKVVATVHERLKELPIQNGQLIFVQDRAKIALDFKNKRIFYRSIITIDTDIERENLEEPVEGSFYFVVDTAILWTYQQKWIQITGNSYDTRYIEIDTSLPQFGNANKLYVNKQDKLIAVWDEEKQDYITVADSIESCSNEDIDQLFKKDEV